MNNGKIQVILRTKLHGFCVFVTCIPGTDKILLSYIKTQYP